MKITSWEPENPEFWEKTGKKTAFRNLIISIPNLTVAFSVWLFWGLIGKSMVDLGFPFDTSQIFFLPAIAGLAGATLRIPNSFLIAIAGGRNVIFITSALLIIPALGAGYYCQQPSTPYYIFAMLAMLSGIGGGAFASSMSNISFFFPKKMQGLSLGLNAGIGNLGVALMQFLIPISVAFAVLGSLTGEPQAIPPSQKIPAAAVDNKILPKLNSEADKNFFLEYYKIKPAKKVGTSIFETDLKKMKPEFQEYVKKFYKKNESGLQYVMKIPAGTSAADAKVMKSKLNEMFDSVGATAGRLYVMKLSQYDLRTGEANKEALVKLTNIMRDQAKYIIGKNPFAGSKQVGDEIYIQNAGYIWVLMLLILTTAAWFGMNNLPTASPGLGSTVGSIGKTLFLVIVIGYAGCILGVFVLLNFGKTLLVALVIVPPTIFLTVMLTKISSYLIPSIKPKLEKDFSIFKDKHNWIMTVLYIMTFGSFIGYSNAFPLFINYVFGYMPDGSINVNAPSLFPWVFIGPALGALIRPIGGWLSDKLGGAPVTLWNTVIMIISALGVGYYANLAMAAEHPEEYFTHTVVLFYILFLTTGIGNGSTFRMIAIIFKDPTKAGPVLGWTSAVAAYGAYLIPTIFRPEIQARTPENALIGFAAFYFVCLILCWWYYTRKNAEIKC